MEILNNAKHNVRPIMPTTYKVAILGLLILAAIIHFRIV
jgi:hypothetical protein